MKDNKRLVLLFVITAAIILGLEFATFQLYQTNRNVMQHVSAILYGENIDWDKLTEGIKLAADNNSVELNMVNTRDINDARSQYDQIVKSIENGADYVIVAPVDSEELGKLLNGQYASKVIFITNGIYDNRYVTITPDDYQMGVSLGFQIIENTEDNATVGIMRSDTVNEYVADRYNGVMEAMKDANRTTVESVLGDVEDIYDETVALLEKQPDVIVALNNKGIENILSAVEDAEYAPLVYVIGNSVEAVYYLDKGRIDTLIYPDEFGMGYAAVKYAVKPKDYKKTDFKRLITYKTVTRKDIYTEEYENVLFPFVK